MSAQNPLPCGCRVAVDDLDIDFRDEDAIDHAYVRHCPLHAAAGQLLAVCKELVESAAYWSEYDVPLGIVDRLKAAIAAAEGTA